MNRPPENQNGRPDEVASGDVLEAVVDVIEVANEKLLHQGEAIGQTRVVSFSSNGTDLYRVTDNYSIVDGKGNVKSLGDLSSGLVIQGVGLENGEPHVKKQVIQLPRVKSKATPYTVRNMRGYQPDEIYELAKALRGGRVIENEATERALKAVSVKVSS